MQPIAITGMGIYGAGYKNTAQLLHRLQNGSSCIQRHQAYPECPFSAATIGAILDKVDFDLNSSAIPTELAAKAAQVTMRKSLVYQSALHALLQAWYQANLQTNFYQPDEIAIIVAGQNLHLRTQYQAASKFNIEPLYVNASYAQQFIDTTLMSFLSEFFNIQGMGFDVGGATASSNLAIQQATKLLDDKIKCCIIIAAMTDLSPVELQAFNQVGALGGEDYADNPSAACRPFDKNHNGFIYGQGSGCIVLETIANAKLRQQPILAKLLAAISCLDAKANTEPSVQGEIRAMQLALAQANITTVDYINPHGTGTPLGDTIEAQAIANVFAHRAFINTTKAITGHTLWAAAMIECIACILQMQHGFLHGNINLDAPIQDKLNFIGKQAIAKTIDTALSMSLGFGGINSAIVLQRGDIAP
jgi:malonyl-ACP decarboxylase